MSNLNFILRFFPVSSCHNFFQTLKGYSSRAVVEFYSKKQCVLQTVTFNFNWPINSLFNHEIQSAKHVDIILKWIKEDFNPALRRENL